jgi:hypothetical protein
MKTTTYKKQKHKNNQVSTNLVVFVFTRFHPFFLTFQLKTDGF